MTKYQHSKLSNPFSRIWAEIKKMQNKRISQCDAVLKPMALAVMCDLPRESVTQNMPHFLCSLEVTFVFFPWSSLVQKHPCASLDGAIPKGLFSNRTVAVSTMTLRLGAFSWFFCWGKATAAWWERCWKQRDNLLKVEMLTKLHRNPEREMSNYWHSQQRWVSSSDYSWSAPVYARSQRIFSSATSFRPSWKWRSSMSLIIGWRVLHSSSWEGITRVPSGASNGEVVKMFLTL